MMDSGRFTSVRSGSAASTRPPVGSSIIWAAPPVAKAGITRGKCYLSADNKLFLSPELFSLAPSSLLLLPAWVGHVAWIGMVDLLDDLSGCVHREPVHDAEPSLRIRDFDLCLGDDRGEVVVVVEVENPNFAENRRHRRPPQGTELLPTHQRIMDSAGCERSAQRYVVIIRDDVKVLLGQTVEVPGGGLLELRLALFSRHDFLLGSATWSVLSVIPLGPLDDVTVDLACPPLLYAGLTDRAYPAGDPLPGARLWDDSPCPPGAQHSAHLERSPPGSFKRLLGSGTAMLGMLRAISARSERDEDQTSRHEADRRGQQGEDGGARRPFGHDRLCDEEGKPDRSSAQSPTLPAPGTRCL